MSFIVATAIGVRDEADRLLDHPDFRRATFNMRLAFTAAQGLVAKIPPSVSRDRIALVLGTSLGELQATYEFLSGLANENVARPLAFQNSLHHSTLGFLSRVLGVTGPGLTTSREYFSGEDALDIALTLLACDEADYALAIGVDAVVEPLKEVLEARIGRSSASGAGAMLLSRKPHEGLELTGIEFEEGTKLCLATEDFFDSNVLSLLASDLAAGTFVFPKPDGRISKVTLREPRV